MRDREKKFLELAETRVNKVLEGMRLIGNLSNKRNYDYTDDQIKKIFSALDDQLKDLKNKFKSENKSNTKFKL
jgi:ABC-type Fe3+-hydroxamate transport system substrate-binding protein